jgi:hypothetical protein
MLTDVQRHKLRSGSRAPWTPIAVIAIILTEDPNEENYAMPDYIIAHLLNPPLTSVNERY